MKPNADRRYKVLVADESLLMHEIIAATLAQEGFAAQGVTSIEEAKKVLVDQPIDLVITELMFRSSGPGNVQSGVDFILWLKGAHPQIPIIALTESVLQTQLWPYSPQPASRKMAAT